VRDKVLGEVQKMTSLIILALVLPCGVNSSHHAKLPLWSTFLSHTAHTLWHDFPWLL
jgi:hypothetical protein